MHAPLAIKESPLSRKATLVNVTVSQWTARKLDRKATKETTDRHNAVADAGRFNKLLIEAQHVKKITEVVNKVRSLHYRLTKPWADEGARILPNTLYAKFANEFRELKREFEDAVDEFCRGYPLMIRQRERALQSLFNPADYPPVDEIREKFSLEFSVMPFPDAADFRSDLDPELAEDIRREIEDQVHKVSDKMTTHTVEQIITLVGHMAERLKEYGNPVGEGSRTAYFRDSLVENIRELADLLPAFNMTNDPRLTKITDRIKRELCVEDAEALRENEKARESVAASADEIVEAVKGLFA